MYHFLTVFAASAKTCLNCYGTFLIKKYVMFSDIDIFFHKC
ncbi:hypothetical protein BRYFOR_05215 [Marvinbryantia formatexigens DSM 14469]|uniref:Uncharacterized protein n=1 Tax=Marvinbryantia formatexigens DSM 14469 TaxID=478749 RepID=C6L9C5_9FIRM|nr:hypothetical protein BRYFOR_05215 [Marvinbryantia formatexigens DSM 14469]